jgi:hypothetical protein
MLTTCRPGGIEGGISLTCFEVNSTAWRQLTVTANTAINTSKRKVRVKTSFGTESAFALSTIVDDSPVKWTRSRLRTCLSRQFPSARGIALQGEDRGKQASDTHGRRVLASDALPLFEPGDIVTHASSRAIAQRPDAFGRVWMRTELKGLHRLDFGLIVDEREARANLQRLQHVRAEAIRFVEGGDHRSYRTGFGAAVAMLATTPEQSSLLQMQVPSLGLDQFGPRADLLIVRPDGGLCQPPRPLLAESATSSQSTGAMSFANQWTAIRAELTAGRPISPENVSKLERTLASWKAATQDAVETAEPLQKSTSRAYLSGATTLVMWLQDEKSTDKVSRYLRTATSEFPGGTVGELVGWVTDNDLTVRYGSQSQMLLTELAYDMTRDLNNQIAILEERIERYKAQNPAHNAAIKGRLLAASGFPNGHRGGFPTSTTLAGSQPAGLQSQAYGGPLPQVQTSPYSTSSLRAGSLAAERRPSMVEPKLRPAGGSQRWAANVVNADLVPGPH